MNFILKITLVVLGMNCFIPNLFSQKKMTFFIEGGPSITNVYSFYRGQKVQYRNPERPFDKISYHFGGGIQLNLNKNLDVAASLGYERKMSSTERFNGPTEKKGDFITFPISLLYCPGNLDRSKLSFEGGLFIDYLIYSDLLDSYLLHSTDLEIGILTGFRLRISNSISGGIRWKGPINFIYKEKNRPLDSGTAIKTSSFQFSMFYEFSK